MAQFKSYNPDAKVIGKSILPMVMGMGERAAPYLDKYGLNEIDPEAWYSQQAFLDACRDVAASEAQSVDFVSIGMNIPAAVNLPPELESIDGVLMSLNEAYHMNQQNDDSGWEVTKVGPGHYVCVSTTPFPHDIEYGVLYGFVRRFRRPNERFTVTVDENAPSRLKGANSSTYIVKVG